MIWTIWTIGFLAALYLVLSCLYSRYVFHRPGRKGVKWYDYPMLLPTIGLVFLMVWLHYITKGKK